MIQNSAKYRYRTISCNRLDRREKIKGTTRKTFPRIWNAGQMSARPVVRPGVILAVGGRRCRRAAGCERCRDLTSRMGWGCMYCEDSAADEFEHFKPKSFFPEQTFSWENYLYSCGPCITGKREKFAVRTPMGEIIHLARKSGDVSVPPPIGASVAIHPTLEDPFDYPVLDIAGETLIFAPVPGLDGAPLERARYTIQLLSLNRDVLVRARREAFRNFT